MKDPRGPTGRARYFVAAARDLIDEGGVASLSARKVGTRAGYSYATLYNYFSDMNELILAAMIETLEELHMVIVERTEEERAPRAKLVLGIEAYLDYFEMHPRRFHLAMVHPVPKVQSEPAVPAITRTMVGLIEACEDAGAKLVGRPEEIAELLGSSLHGKLLFYFSGRGYRHYSMLRNQVLRELDRLVKWEIDVQ